MNYRKISLLLICVWLLLAGCTSAPAAQTEVPTTQAPKQMFTVHFYYRGQQVHEEQVPEGECPQLLPTCAEPDYVADSWIDDSGNVVDPQTAPVRGDTNYTARVYPTFTNHVPYLFADENGFIRPDDPLTGEELVQALQALVRDPAALADIVFPEAEILVTKEPLYQLFTALFPQKKLESAMFNLKDGEVSRAAFAQLMNTLTDRYATETVSLAQGQSLPRDLALNRADSDDVLEAVLVHEPWNNGYLILDAVFAQPWTPGFTNLGGWLYYADEDGNVLRDGQVGTLTFGSDGCYTSGDTELDKIVASKLNQFIRENPDLDTFDLLYVIFLHCRDDYKYVGRGLLEPGQTGWEAEWAKQMFTSGAGNCYSYAAIFWAYARNLGYDAYCVSGWTTEEYDPHGWVEIQLAEDEMPRIFDPELAMAYLRDGKNYEAVWNMDFWLAVQWPYHWPS